MAHRSHEFRRETRPVNLGNADEFTVGDFAEVVRDCTKRFKGRTGETTQREARLLYKLMPSDDPLRRRPDNSRGRRRFSVGILVGLWLCGVSRRWSGDYKAQLAEEKHYCLKALNKRRDVVTVVESSIFLGYKSTDILVMQRIDLTTCQPVTASSNPRLIEILTVMGRVLQGNYARRYIQMHDTGLEGVNYIQRPSLRILKDSSREEQGISSAIIPMDCITK